MSAGQSRRCRFPAAGLHAVLRCAAERRRHVYVCCVRGSSTRGGLGWSIGVSRRCVCWGVGVWILGVCACAVPERVGSVGVACCSLPGVTDCAVCCLGVGFGNSQIFLGVVTLGPVLG